MNNLLIIFLIILLIFCLTVNNIENFVIRRPYIQRPIIRTCEDKCYWTSPNRQHINKCLEKC